MSALSDHARAARLTAQAFQEVGNEDMESGLLDSSIVALSIAAGYNRAAQLMEDQARADLVGHTCTLDHATIKGPTCTACGARTGKR